ncbi:FkbM family methyltransferase [Pseudanabaenaceae cyanobacterium LEGE 13415]|nr:FkbM family methyltransferase [Pseudanabaenaceae cyanobacterium LEGE 13415]
MMNISTFVKRLIYRNPQISLAILNKVRQLGFDIVEGVNPELALLSNSGIDVILDIGANQGQYARRLRTLGYKGRIVSFEPTAEVFSQLQARSSADPLWTVVQLGLGNYDGTATIHVSESSVFSSLLPQAPLLNQTYPESTYVKTEDIQIHQLDTIFEQYCKPDDRAFLKIDVQGFEPQVLEGAINSLDQVLGVQLELSFVQHYEGEPLMREMQDWLQNQGFTLVLLKPLEHNLHDNQLLQADGLFFRLNSGK